MTDWAGYMSLPRRAPNAAWAWEGLRRNAEYRRVWFGSRQSWPRAIRLQTGADYTRLRSRHRQAEGFGLLALADPDKPAIKADIFWRPDCLAGCLDVRLSPLRADECHDTGDDGAIFLHRLHTRRTILETVDGVRHIVLNGRRFWIQLVCSQPGVIGEAAHVGIRLNQTAAMERHLDSAAQLLSLYRAEGGKLGLIGRRKNTDPLAKALIAHDIWTGFERPKGTLRDIAIALVGDNRVEEDWTGSSRCLKDMARRARDKGLNFVESGYRDLLSRSVT